MARSTGYPLAAVVSWGLMFAILNRALTRVDPFNLTAIRYAVTALILLTLLVATQGWAALRPTGHAREILLLGTVGFAGFNLLTNLALQRTAPQNAALVVALTPLMTVGVRWLRDGVRPRAYMVGLAGVALLGVLLVITKGRVTELSALGAGDLLMLGAVAGWAMYTHGAGRFPEWPPLRYAALTAATGTATIIVLAGLADAVGAAHVPAMSDLVAVGPELAYVVVIGSVLAVLAWNTGVRRLGAPNAALFMNLVPVVALVLATVTGYRPGPAEVAGTALTVAAIVAANVLARRPAPVASVAPVMATGR